MAHLEVKTWAKRDGTTRAADNFTVHISFDRRKYRIPGFGTDAMGRGLSEELGRNAERLLAGKASGAVRPELRRYVEGLPVYIRRSMATQGIIDAVAEGKTLVEQVTDFKVALLAKGVTERHAREVEATILEVARGCGAKMIGDVTPARVRAHLTDRRKDKPRLKSDGTPEKYAAGAVVMKRGISAERHNHILAALHSLFRWAMKEHRAYENPIDNVSKLNAKTDVRHARRALEPVEVRRLLAAAKKGAEMFGMSGTERALVYLLAAETGLRSNELATLTRGCVDLEAQEVTVRAKNAKNRRQDVLPIRTEMVKALRTHVEKKAPAARLFNMPDRYKVLRAFRADCAAAGIAVADGEGRVVDFHGLRHTFISSLVNGGTHPKTAQELARHSTITLTMDRYTHTLRGAGAAALAAALPNYSMPDTTQVKRTGTDDAVLPVDGKDGKRGERRGDFLGGKPCLPCTTVDNTASADDMHKTLDNIGETNGGGGIRTPERLAALPVFKTGALNRSATPPGRGM